MPDPQDQSFAAWIKPLQSPLWWVVLVHAGLFLSVFLYRMTYAPSDFVLAFEGSLVIAQLMLIFVGMTFQAPRGRPTLSPEAGVSFLLSIMFMLLMGYAFLRGHPQWFLVPVFANAILSRMRMKGWQLKRFAPHEMPPERTFQFTIVSILLATGIVAVLFALAAISSLLRSDQEHLWALAILIDVPLTFAIYASIPTAALWAVLTPGSVLPRLGIIGSGLGLVAILISQGIADWSAAPIAPAPMLVASMGIFFVTLFAVRALGYRLVRGTPIPGLFRALAGKSDDTPKE